MSIRSLVLTLPMIMLTIPLCFGDDEPVQRFTRATAVMDSPPGVTEKEPMGWRSIVLSPDGRVLVGCGSRNAVDQIGINAAIAHWNADSGKLRRTISSNGVYELDLSNDSKSVIGRGGARMNRIGADSLLYWILEEEQAGSVPLNLKADGPMLDQQFLSGRRLGMVTPSGFFIWEDRPVAVRAFGGRAWSLRPSKSGADRIIVNDRILSSLAASGDGSIWVVNNDNRTIQAWDLRTGKLRFEIPRRLGCRAAITTDGKTMILASSLDSNDPGDVEIRSCADGKVLVKLKQVPLPPTALAVSADSSTFAVGGGTGTVAIGRISDGKVTDEIAQLSNRVNAVKLTSNGKLLATADEKSVQVWNLERLRQLTPSTDSHPESASWLALARGPISVTIEAGGKIEQRVLLGLTPQKFISRDVEGGRSTAESATGRIQKIVDSKNGRSWTFDEKIKAFVGPIVEGSPEGTQPRQESVAFDNRQLQIYLYLGWRRMRNHGMEVVHNEINSKELIDLKEIANRNAEFVRKNSLHPVLAEVYSALPGYFDAMSLELAQQRQLILEHNSKIQEIKAERKRQQAELRARRMMAFSAMFIGAMPVSQTVADSNGQYLEIQNGIFSEDLFQQGLTSALNTSLDEFRREHALKQSAAIADGEMRRRFEQSLDVQKKSTSELFENFRRLDKESFALPDLPELSPADLSAANSTLNASSIQALLDRLAERAESERQLLGHQNPFTIAESTYLFAMSDSVKDPLERSTKLRKAADAIRQLLKLIPADPTFDADRADLAARAGYLALRAAAFETGTQSWSYAFSEDAMMAKGLFEQSLSMAPADSSGRIREQLALAGMLSGYANEALELAATIRTIRGHSARFMYQLARMKCSVGRFDEGYNDLCDAVERLGFEDIQEASRALDFAGNDARFQNLLKIKVEVAVQPKDGGVEFRVVNASRFALREAKIDVSFRGISLKGQLATQHCDSIVQLLEPGDVAILRAPRDIRVAPVRRNASVATKVTVVTRNQGRLIEDLD